jgi:hypothetical protein
MTALPGESSFRYDFLQDGQGRGDRRRVTGGLLSGRFNPSTMTCALCTSRKCHDSFAFKTAPSRFIKHEQHYRYA